MEKKRQQNKEELESEIHQIEQDFQNVVGEMTDLENIREFTDIYRQLHSLLMDSHSKNDQLTSAAQTLNSQIISNATKVSSLLKMSEDDHKCIEQYRDEFDKAWKLVTSSQEKEMKSKEICEDMKQQVDKLAALIHEQSVSDTRFDEERVDLTNYKDEVARNAKEINVLEEEIMKTKSLIFKTNESLETSKSEANALEESIQLEGKELDKLQTSKTQYYSKIDKMKSDELNMIQETSAQINNIKSTKNNISKLQLQIDSLFNELNEAKTQCNASLVMMHDRQKQLASVEGSQLIIYNRVKAAESEVLSKNRFIEQEKKRIESLDDVIKEHERELEESKNIHKSISKQIIETEEQRKAMSNKHIQTTRTFNALDSNIKAAKRDNDSQARVLQQQKTKLNKEKNAITEIQDLGTLTEFGITGEKKSIEYLNFYAHQLEMESKNYLMQANEMKVNTFRHVDNTHLTNTEIRNSNVLFHNIEQQMKEHEIIVQNMRKERDAISNNISGIEIENEELRKNINSTREELQKLKLTAQQKAKDCIMEHFKSRSLEKQNNSLKEMVEITQKMTDEATSTIIKYKSEQTKLNLIIVESEKDINHANTELKSIDEVMTMLKTQLSRRNGEIINEQEKSTSLYYELERRSSKYSQQSKMLEDLDQEMTKSVMYNKYLRNKTSTHSTLTAEKISLESSLLREKELCNRLEQEFSRPLNVHRWTIMASMNPDQFKQIQLIQYLKGKLEEVKREKIKLDASKGKIMKDLTTTNTRVQNARYFNDDIAHEAMKRSIQQKDLELEKTQREIETTKIEMEQLKEEVMNLRLRVKETKVKSTNLKRANQQMQRPAIPLLPINQKPFEMVRLGGGFSLASERAQSARAEVSVHQLEFEEDNQVPSTSRLYAGSQRGNRVKKQSLGCSSARSNHSTSSSRSKAKEEIDYSAKRKTDTSARKKSKNDNDSALLKRRKSDLSSLSIESKDEPLSARRKTDTKQTARAKPSVPPVAITQINVINVAQEYPHNSSSLSSRTNSSTCSKSSRKEKDVAPAQLWVPPVSSEKQPFGDMPGLIIQSARRQKAGIDSEKGTTKKHPMKTSHPKK